MRLLQSKAVHLSRLPGRMFPGRLAEAYDGIGQFVSVILSTGSTAVAYKARVAAGDFGGGRVFPAGTPVHLVSYRGKLEVHLGNQPAVCPCLETFNRVEVSGLGTGKWGTWLLDEDFIGSVNGTHAVIDMEGNSYAYVPIEQVSLPFEVLTEFQPRGRAPASGWSGAGSTRWQFEYSMTIGVGYFGIVRTGANIFTSGTYPNAVIFPDSIDGRTFASGPVGSDSANLPISLPPDDVLVGPLMMRYYVDDHGIYMRVWYKGTPEPKTSTPDVATIPFDVIQGFDPSIQPQWLAGGWGKGEAWSTYQANFEGYTNPLPPGWDTFTAFGFGNSANLEVDYMCRLSGAACVG